MTHEIDRLSDEANALLAAARGEEGPSAEQRGRMRAALVTRLAVGAMSLTAADAAAATGGTTAVGGGGVLAGASLVGKWIAIVALVGGGVGIGIALQARRGLGPPVEACVAVRSASLVQSAPAPEVPAPALPVPASPAAPTTAAVRVRPQHAARGTSVRPGAGAPVAEVALPPPEVAAPAAAVAPPTDLEAEVTALREVRTALRRGDATRALELLERHRLGFPFAALAEEAAALRVEALCAARRAADADAAMAAFLERWPDSLLMKRMRRACAPKESQ